MASNRDLLRMTRWIWATVCFLLAGGMLLCGLLVPMHLRAVDASVLERAGRPTPGVVERGLALADEKNLGAARMLLQVATTHGAVGRDRLAAAVQTLAGATPGNLLETGEPLLQRLFTGTAAKGPEPITDLVIRQENRIRVLEFLKASPRAEVRELVRCRTLTNTVFFPPATSTSGQAFDAALSLCGLLWQEGKLAAGLSNAVRLAVGQAKGDVRLPAGATAPTLPLEEILVDFMSLGQRLNWGQLEAFVGQVPDAGTLRHLAAVARRVDQKLPVLFAVVIVSGRPAEIASYLTHFGETGMPDLETTLSSGAGGLKELLTRNQRWYRSSFGRRLAGYAPFDAFAWSAAGYAWLMPQLALAGKWGFYLGAGFLLAMAGHFSRPEISGLERPLEVRGFHLAREVLFALGFLVVTVMLSEPFLSDESQKVMLPFRLRLPIVGNAAPAVLANATPLNIMNPSVLTLLLFFVIQGFIYTACLLKLAEIRRQNVSARMKLKLLENEDHLFDAGLYIGFAGTIISLILISQGVIKQPSLMAAYSSTSFGIIFVVVFKIFNLRPLRRRYLLEAEPHSASPGAASRAPTTATTA